MTGEDARHSTITFLLSDKSVRPTQSSAIQTNKLRATLDRLAFFYESLHPAENALPSFTVALSGSDVAGESGVANCHHRSSSDAPWTLMLQAVNVARFEFPAHNCVVEIGETGLPSMNQQPRRINFEVFASNAERLTVFADTLAQPFSADTNISFGGGETIESLIAPPFCGLARIGDGCEDASGRSGDKDFRSDDIVVGSDLSGGHSFPRFKSLASFDEGFQPVHRRAPAVLVALSLIEMIGET
jgi:hypothetical protein